MGKERSGNSRCWRREQRRDLRSPLRVEDGGLWLCRGGARKGKQWHRASPGAAGALERHGAHGGGGRGGSTEEGRRPVAGAGAAGGWRGRMGDAVVDTGLAAAVAAAGDAAVCQQLKRKSDTTDFEVDSSDRMNLGSTGVGVAASLFQTPISGKIGKGGKSSRLTKCNRSVPQTPCSNIGAPSINNLTPAGPCPYDSSLGP